MLISVCICTFRRPQLLAGLLAALAQQDLKDLGAGVEWVVVDNDPDHSAREVLEGWNRGAPVFPLRFFHVAQSNISIARNTAVSQARGDWVAFIDDDETPLADWLFQLADAQRRFQADAVFGPVVPRYRADTPDWICQGGYFDRARHKTGTVIDEADARTGNVLIRTESLRSLPGPFDLSFGRTGGEDSLLFRDLLARQCKFVWCDEAPVSEEVPQDRATARWLVKRSFRVGQTWIRGELYRLGPGQRRLRGGILGSRAAIQLVLSLLFALLWVIPSRIKAFQWVRVAAMQAGKLLGMTRFQYNEYAG